MNIEINEFRNAQYLVDGRINCDINHPVYGWIQFTADREDTGALFDVVEFFDRMVASGQVAPYVPPSQEEIDAQAANAARVFRNELLMYVVDPLVTNPLRWADLAPEKQAEWTAYRRALLDITEQAGFPHNVTWPEQP